MSSAVFRREPAASWKGREATRATADKRGMRTLSAEHLARLPHLYRATLSSLSVARSISLDRALTDYLESLCGRAYFCVYGTREPARSKIFEFFAGKGPAAGRRVEGRVPVSVLVLAVGFFH